MVKKIGIGKRNRLFAALLMLFGLIAAPTYVSATVAGALDRTFDGDGKLFTMFAAGSSPEQAQDIAVQPDGKIVVVGSYNGNFAVVRYNPNGTFDTSFNGSGKVLTMFTSGGGGANAVIIQPNGKIIVAGTVFSGASQGFGVARYNADGTLDTTYGTLGTTFTLFGVVSTSANGAAQQPDGKVIVVGTKGGGTSADFQIVRFNTDGTLDTTFDADGIITKDVSGALDICSAVIVRNNGKIVPVGLANGQIAVLRYNEDGTPDTSFDMDGVALTDVTDGTDSAEDVYALADGKLLVAGYAATDVALLTYNANGSLDTSFDGDGIVITDLGTTKDEINAMAVQADGKIVLVGGAGFSPSHSVVVRYNADGSLDTSFDGDGKVYTTFANADTLFGVAIQPDGKIVAAGYAENSTTGRDFAVARYLAVATGVKSDFDGDGKTDVSVFRPPTGIWYLNQSTAGFYGAQFGTSTDKIVPADYDADGKTDLAVYRPSNGIWYVMRSSNGTFYGTAFGISSDLPAPGDFDGDGRADQAVFRQSISGSTWYLNQSTNGFAAVQFGTQNDTPVVGDYDADGKSDIAVWRPSNGAWYVLRSSLGFTGAQFGQSGDIPVPGDYDADGKTDYAVYRSGIWYVTQSGNGAFSASAFGLSSDKPTPGDFDGDGRTDQAVFRRSEGIWYLNRSTAGFTGIPFGIGGDLPTMEATVNTP